MADSKTDDGGSAFPWQVSIPSGSYNPLKGSVVPTGEQDNEIFTGMSLRDWFAGQAIHVAWDARDKGYYEGDTAEVAQSAYQLADAMIAARKAGAA